MAYDIRSELIGLVVPDDLRPDCDMYRNLVGVVDTLLANPVTVTDQRTSDRSIAAAAERYRSVMGRIG